MFLIREDKAAPFLTYKLGGHKNAGNSISGFQISKLFWALSL
jgi:hypothetical protein